MEPHRHTTSKHGTPRSLICTLSARARAHTPCIIAATSRHTLRTCTATCQRAAASSGSWNEPAAALRPSRRAHRHTHVHTPEAPSHIGAAEARRTA